MSGSSISVQVNVVENSRCVGNPVISHSMPNTSDDYRRRNELWGYDKCSTSVTAILNAQILRDIKPHHLPNSYRSFGGNKTSTSGTASLKEAPGFKSGKGKRNIKLSTWSCREIRMQDEFTV